MPDIAIDGISETSLIKGQEKHISSGILAHEFSGGGVVMVSNAEDVFVEFKRCGR